MACQCNNPSIVTNCGCNGTAVPNRTIVVPQSSCGCGGMTVIRPEATPAADTSLMDSCRITPVSGCQCAGNCIPIDVEPEPVVYRRCTDQSGNSALYPAKCRNQFWPDFSHPRWLCCNELYCVNR